MVQRRSRPARGFASLLKLSLALLLLQAAALPASASQRCPGAETTLAMRECLDRLLQQSDRVLARELNGIASEAGGGAGASFARIWRAAAEESFGGADPALQLRRYQEQRRRICLYSNSLSLQGSGFGSFVMACELDLNDALLRQIRS